MSVPPAPSELDARLSRDDLGLPPAIAAGLSGRDDLRRALTTACRLTWSTEPWAVRQGEELCRALAASEPAARAALLAPLVAGASLELTDGPWIPLALLARLAAEAAEHGIDPGGDRVEALTIRATTSEVLPPLPPGLRRLTIADAPDLAAGEPAFLPGLRALSVTGSPGVEPWRSEVLPGHRGWVRAVGWSPDGRTLATAGSDAALLVRREEATGWRSDPPLEGHARPIAALEWNPCTPRLATASADHSVRIWSEVGGRWRESAALAHPAEVTSIRWSPDGARLVTVADDPIVRVWSPTQEGWRSEELAGHGGLGQCAEWSPDGTMLVTGAGDATVRLWTDDGTKIVETDLLTEHDDWVRAVAWSPDGTRIACGSDDGRARIIALRRGPLGRVRRGRGEGIELTGHEGWVRRVLWSPRGDAVLTCADDGVLRWFATGGEGSTRDPSAEFAHGVRITAAAWSPSGPALATGDDSGMLRVFLAEEGEGGGTPAPRPVEGTGHEGTIAALAWHPGGTALITGSDDRTARVWRPSERGLGGAWRVLLERDR